MQKPPNIATVRTTDNKYNIMITAIFLVFQLTAVQYECVRWRWTGDVFDRKVYCVEWRVKDCSNRLHKELCEKSG